MTVLALILASVMLVDVIAAATVYVERRDAPDFPDFRRADTTSVDWQVEPYPSPADAGFTVDIAEPGKVDGSGRVTYREGAISPGLSAMYVIAALDKAHKTGDDQWVQRATTAMNQVLRTSQNGFLPHQFDDTDVFGHQLPHPWYSSQAQGLVLSALARLYEVTGDEKWRTSSDPVFAAMTTFRGFLAGSKPAAEPWLDVLDTEGYLWFEQFTHGIAPTKVLASEMQAAIGIYDYQRVLADRPAERRKGRLFFAGSLATVEKYVPLSRTPGWVSVTSLASGQHDPIEHNVVEDQLATFGRITHDAALARMALLFDEDDNLPVFNITRLRPLNADVRVYSPLPDEPWFSVKPPEPASVSKSGRVTYREGLVNPTLSASYALTALDRYAKTDDRAWLDRATVAVDQALQTSKKGLLPYRFSNSNIYGSPLPIPWYSAEGQGLMLSAMAELYRVTDNPVWVTRSRDVFEALTRVRDVSVDGAPPPQPWLSFRSDDGYLWFEQYAGGVSASLVVPGHLTALLGVYDYWLITRSPSAEWLFNGGVTTVRHYLPIIRKPGRPALYAVGNKSSDPRFDNIVTRQLVTLAKITGDNRIRRFARSSS